MMINNELTRMRMSAMHAGFAVCDYSYELSPWFNLCMNTAGERNEIDIKLQ